MHDLEFTSPIKRAEHRLPDVVPQPKPRRSNNANAIRLQRLAVAQFAQRLHRVIAIGVDLRKNPLSAGNQTVALLRIRRGNERLRRENPGFLLKQSSQSVLPPRAGDEPQTM